jgi:hypothetical protein
MGPFDILPTFLVNMALSGGDGSKKKKEHNNGYGDGQRVLQML